MPLYEYFCQDCEGVFEAMRPMSQASSAANCPHCSRPAERIMSPFSAFTMREGYPRRIPDKGNYWHLGNEVKRLTNSVVHGQHPDLIKPQRKPSPSKRKRKEIEEKQVEIQSELRYRENWGIDEKGLPLPKTVTPKNSDE
ncbi:MAG TPA: zinc ribbon domain-containing protein [Dehalococcoidia bacterium]|nr:zinc ribbon domain-containing protein [Dehalococcoidia bacterium]